MRYIAEVTYTVNGHPITISDQETHFEEAMDFIADQFYAGYVITSATIILSTGQLIIKVK